MKVLIIQQKMIGDVLITSTLCHALKNLYPSSQIHYLVNSNTVAVVKNNPCIDVLVEFVPDYKRSKKQLWRFAQTMRNEQFDLLIDVYSKPESNLVSLLSRATIRVSYHKWYSSWIYTHTVKRALGNAQQKALENRLKLLNCALLNLTKPKAQAEKKIEDPATETHQSDSTVSKLPIMALKPAKIFINAQELTIAANFLKQQGISTEPLRPIMLNILGTHNNKTYPLHYMAEVIDFIAQNTDADLLINYMPGQEGKVAELIKQCHQNTQLRLKLKNVTPSLRSFLAILSHCSALIGNEGGAIHMAQALDKPTFAIFSPWVPKEEWALKKDAAHRAIHLKDFEPGYIVKQSVTELKKLSAPLYQKLKPSCFTDQLQQFLQQFVGSSPGLTKHQPDHDIGH